MYRNYTENAEYCRCQLNDQTYETGCFSTLICFIQARAVLMPLECKKLRSHLHPTDWQKSRPVVVFFAALAMFPTKPVTQVFI
uniref:Phlebovirus_G2 domain-containing protein n=1 Tax=Steinernema glaseri TaxID=37863 RepID=A0A1I7YVE9_9BILA